MSALPSKATAKADIVMNAGLTVAPRAASGARRHNVGPQHQRPRQTTRSMRRCLGRIRQLAFRCGNGLLPLFVG